MIYHGDCREVMREIPDNSVDAIITDPPYPFVPRGYGKWDEQEWMGLMQDVVTQSRRVLKPHGSAVYILQLNSEKVGKMRNWLWKFLVWASEEWNVVQDMYWWNISTLPSVHCHRDRGLCRSSVKTMVWLGEPDCYKNQDEVLWSYSHHVLAKNKQNAALRLSPSGWKNNEKRMNSTSIERGGSTPFNLLPIANSVSNNKSAGWYGHGAGTPKELVVWWLKYINKEGDTVLDPFLGSGTTALAAYEMGREVIGIEAMEDHYRTSIHRIELLKEDLKSINKDSKIEEVIKNG